MTTAVDTPPENELQTRPSSLSKSQQPRRSSLRRPSKMVTSVQNLRPEEEDDKAAEERGRRMLLEVQREAELVERFQRLRELLPPPGEDGGEATEVYESGDSTRSFDASPPSSSRSLPKHHHFRESSEDEVNLDPSLFTTRGGVDDNGGSGINPRFPFLSLLFRDGSSSDILADEEAAKKHDNPIVHVFLWKDPMVSLLWLMVVHLTFGFVTFANISIITLIGYLSLWQLIVDVLILHVGPHMQRARLIPPNVDLRELVRRSRFFSPKLVRQVADAAGELADLMIGYYKIVIIEGQLVELWWIGRIIFFVFIRSFSVTVTLYLMLVALFTLPVSVTQNWVLYEALLEAWRIRWQNFRLAIEKVFPLAGPHRRFPSSPREAKG